MKENLRKVDRVLKKTLPSGVSIRQHISVKKWEKGEKKKNKKPVSVIIFKRFKKRFACDMHAFTSKREAQISIRWPTKGRRRRRFVVKRSVEVNVDTFSSAAVAPSLKSS